MNGFLKQGILLSGLFCVWGIVGCSHVPYPRTAKLIDCTLSELRFSRTLEAGDGFHIVLGVPNSSQLPPSFHGEIIISHSGSQIGDYPIGSDDMQECNWLDDAPELQGYILGWKGALPSSGLNGVLRAGNTYDFVVKFSQRPPAGSSLWFTWLE